MQHQTSANAPGKRRRVSVYLLSAAFLGVAGIAMIAWFAVIAWASWRLIAWLFS